MYVCMHVCMRICMHSQASSCIQAFMYSCIHVHMHRHRFIPTATVVLAQQLFRSSPRLRGNLRGLQESLEMQVPGPGWTV